MTGCRPVVSRCCPRSRLDFRLWPLLAALAVAAAWYRPALAAPYDGQPKILLHLAGVTTKSACAAGQLSDCGTAVVSGSLASGGGPYYYAYVLVAKGNLPDLAGVQFGIRYQDGCVIGRNDGRRVDVLGWTHCGALEFVTPGFYAWPGPNSGNLITWSASSQCQVSETAVAGFFYVACYSDADTLRIIPRPVDQRAAVARCNSDETTVGLSGLGSVAFSAGGGTAGCNPCNGPCAAPPTYLSCGPGVDYTPPGVVSISLAQRTGQSITLEWQAPGDDGYGGGPASIYDLRQLNDPLDPFESGLPVGDVPSPAAPGTTQTALILGLAPGQTYHFRLRSGDEVPNWSNPSNLLSVTTLQTPNDLVAPAAITDLGAVSVGLHSIRLGWTATGDDGTTGTAATYELRRSATPIATHADFAAATLVGGLPAPTAAGTHQETNVTGLDAGTTYYFALRVRDEAANASPLSNSPGIATIPSTEQVPPAAITDLHPLGATSTSVRLGWTATGDDGSIGSATLYDIRYSGSPITAANFATAAQASGEPVPLPAGTPQEFTVTGLATGAFYYFAMTVADNEENVSLLSNVTTRRTSDNSGAKLLLHNRSVTTKNQCARGELADCATAVVNNGALYPTIYYAYLLAGQMGEVGGLQCGIQYDLGAADGDANHRGIDVYAWTSCADQQTPSESPGWPRPGSGNLLTWSGPLHCQTAGTAVGGYFYVGAYGVDLLQLTPRPSDGLARVYDCQGVSQDITATGLGSIGYGRLGFNPCVSSGPPTLPVTLSTWSQIKTLLAH